MGKIALVGFEVETGSRILKILDDAGLQVKVALWAVLPEYEEWRLILSSRKFDDESLFEAYGQLNMALDNAGFPLERTPTIVIMRSTDPFIKALRKIYRKTKNVEGVRPGGQMIGDRFVEDGFAYRVS